MTAPLPAWTEDAVLVYGPRKAGTTLLQNLLDGSPEMLAYPAELKLKYFIRQQPTAETWRAASRIGEVKSPRFSYATYERLRSEAGSDGGLGSLVRHEALAVAGACNPPPSPRLWCAKEVGGGTDAILALWREMFPRGRMLLILRDPRLITRAILNDRRRKRRHLPLHAIAREAWDSLRVVRAQSRHLGAPGVLAITYEDLVADPSDTMARIARFLGIAAWPVMTTPTLFGEAIVVRTASRSETAIFAGTEDWRDGLSLREQRTVSAVFAFAGVLGLAPDYPTIRGKLKPPAPSAAPDRG